MKQYIPTPEQITEVMDRTGMGYLQAKRHLEQREFLKRQAEQVRLTKLSTLFKN